MISTRAGILLGQVHDGMMVGLRADNAKLVARATGMVAAIAGVGEAAATAALQAAGMAVKPAVLIALGATPSATAALLADTQDNLRAALARLQTTGTRKAG
jgi:N-acetylmuramic acid 6-phosphate etherase